MAARYDGPPPPRAWADRDPIAAARLARARSDLKHLAESHDMPVENLLTPDYVRRLLWEPPLDGSGGTSPELVEARLRQLGARSWQVELTRDVLVKAIQEARPGEERLAADADADADEVP